MSRQTPSLAFTLLRNPPLQSPFSLQPFSSAPSSGLWRNRSASPPSESRLHREAQKGRLMCPPPCNPPFWALFTLPWALDTQAASVLSRSSKLGTGGPVWPGMSPCMSADAQSAPSPNLHVTYLPENWFPYRFLVVRGPTPESTSSPISPTLRGIPVSSSLWIGYPRPAG